MKRQQLFNNFWLASTVAILAIQPAWADSVLMSQLKQPPITKLDLNLAAPSFSHVSSNINTLSFLKDRTFTTFEPTNSTTDITLTPLNVKSFQVNVTQGQSSFNHSDRSLSNLTRLRQLAQNPQEPLNQENPALDNRSQPNQSAPTLTPLDSERNQQTPVPSYLNSNPNPLQFPTRPEEVQIQGSEPITLQQAFALGRRNNRQLQIAELTLERSNAALREQQAALYPDLTLNSDITRSRSASGELQAASRANQQLLLDNSNLDQGSTALSGTLQLSYDLYTGGERSARIRAAEEQLRLDRLEVERVDEEIRLNVANDYYNLQAADEQVRISRVAVTNAEASLRDAQALEQAGVGTRFDVLRSQVQLANATQDLTNALGDQQIARRQLATRLSLSQSVTITAADPVEIAGLWNPTLEQSIVLAFQNRAELQQELARRNISTQNRRIARSTTKPRFSLVGSYNVLDDYDDDFNIADGYALGARVTWNLYDGGAARARGRQEDANIAITETRFADTRNNIRFEVEQAYADLVSNLENIQTASVALEQAREALRLARLRFQAGVGTQTDVINAENDLTRAEGRRVTAILDYNRALVSLQRAISAGPPR